jgi:hypothetical protein
MIMNMLSVSIVELQKRNECIDLSEEKNSRMSGNFFVQILFRFENVGRNVLRRMEYKKYKKLLDK